MRRRNFLYLASLLPLITSVPEVFASTGGMLARRRLVLIELNGGNDGLNTIVPYTQQEYYILRPQLAISRQQIIQLDELVGLNPALQPLKPAWDMQELAIIQGLGYDHPNRSHFRSSAIWETGSGSEKILQQGWLAQLFSTGDSPSGTLADGIVLGHGNGPLQGGAMRTILLRNPERFVKQAGRAVTQVQYSTNPALAHILAVQNDLQQAARLLEANLATTPAESGDYPQTRFGRQLALASRLIRSNIQVPVIKLSHGSFDTHSNQRRRHDRLLRELAEGLAVFRSHLQHSGQWNSVLIMTYSEFGRRPEQNGSNGTDHGTAAPQLLMGGHLKGGLYGHQASLRHLNNGDMSHHVDYRQMYSTIARHWWHLKQPLPWGNQYPALDCLS